MAHTFSTSTALNAAQPGYEPTCEQVSIEGYTAHYADNLRTYVELPVYRECSSPVASHFVEWSDGAGLGQMNMCTAHKDEFLDDAEASDEIEGVWVETLVYNHDPRNVVGFL